MFSVFVKVFSLEVIQDLRLLKRKMFYYKPQLGKEMDFW
jgi:hypothetical protein